VFYMISVYEGAPSALVHGTPLERWQRQWRRVDGISLMCRFEFCDLLIDLGDHLP
jgi:hypothetical protein